MTRKQLISRLSGSTGLSRDHAAAVLEAVLDEIAQTLAAGEAVRLSGFGAFTVADRPEVRARHPQTGEPLTRPAYRAVWFRAGEGLKSALNG